MPRTAATGRTAATNRVAVQDMKASLQFNGTSSYMTSPVVPDITGFCFSFWFTYGVVSAKTLIGWSNNATPSQGFRLVTEASTDNVYVAVSHSGGTKYVDAGSKKFRNKWVNVVFTHVQGAQKIYVNGVLTDSDTGTMVDATGQTLTIGRNSYAATEYFSGSMSNLVFHNTTTPWTQGQVTALYTSGTIPTGATAIMPLQEGAGTTALDTSGNGNHGTITDGTYTADVPTKKRGLVGGNLVYNGDFEYAPVGGVPTTSGFNWIDGTVGGSSTNGLFGWQVVNRIGTTSIGFDNTVSNTGSNSLKIRLLATGSWGGIGTTSGAKNSRGIGSGQPSIFTVLPNTSYTISLYMKTQHYSGTANTGAVCQIINYKANGSTVGYVADVMNGVLSTTDWTKYSLTFTTEPETSFLQILPRVVGSNGAATLIMDAWFDDITLTPTTNTTRTAV